MIKYYCDCCGVEANLKRFSYYCHLDPSRRWAGMSDLKTNQPTSGREERKDLCITCYNKIVSKAITEYVKLYEENK